MLPLLGDCVGRYLCFWVLGLGLVAPAGESAASGRVWASGGGGSVMEGTGGVPEGEGELLAVLPLPPPGYRSSRDAEKIN